jgi:hypothetical protein
MSCYFGVSTLFNFLGAMNHSKDDPHLLDQNWGYIRSEPFGCKAALSIMAKEVTARYIYCVKTKGTN